MGLGVNAEGRHSCSARRSAMVKAGHSYPARGTALTETR